VSHSEGSSTATYSNAGHRSGLDVSAFLQQPASEVQRVRRSVLQWLAVNRGRLLPLRGGQRVMVRSRLDMQQWGRPQLSRWATIEVQLPRSNSIAS